MPMGTHKNITPESLVPYSVPVQPCKYHLPLLTFCKEMLAMFAWKRAQSSAPGEVEGTIEPTLSEEDTIKTKCLQNTHAARRSRKRKLEYQCELEDAIDAERKDKKMWRAHVLILDAILCDKGHKVPQMIE